MSRPARISVAIAVFNEETVLLELYRRVDAVLSRIPDGPHEIVFINDGSTDSTSEILESLVYADPRVTVVELSRNFGHQAALTAGLDHATGDVVIVMDGDLQDSPETIPQFLKEYEEGADVVYAVRRDRKENWLLKACYDGFYQLIAAMADIPLPLGAGDFGLMSRRVVEVLKRSPERHRYLRGLRCWAGFRQVGIPVERASRHSGRSKYSVRKLLKLASDGIFSFSLVPLRAATLVGAVSLAASIAFAAYCVFARLFLSQSPSGFTALYVSMVFLGGVQLLFLGVIGEYVGRIYEQSKQRPLYVVDRRLTADSPAGQRDGRAAADRRPHGEPPLRQPEPLSAARHE